MSNPSRCQAREPIGAGAGVASSAAVAAKAAAMAAVSRTRAMRAGRPFEAQAGIGGACRRSVSQRALASCEGAASPMACGNGTAVQAQSTTFHPANARRAQTASPVSAQWSRACSACSDDPSCDVAGVASAAPIAPSAWPA